MQRGQAEQSGEGGAPAPPRGTPGCSQLRRRRAGGSATLAELQTPGVRRRRRTRAAGRASQSPVGRHHVAAAPACRGRGGRSAAGRGGRGPQASTARILGRAPGPERSAPALLHALPSVLTSRKEDSTASSTSSALLFARPFMTASYTCPAKQAARSERRQRLCSAGLTGRRGRPCAHAECRHTAAHDCPPARSAAARRVRSCLQHSQGPLSPGLPRTQKNDVVPKPPAMRSTDSTGYRSGDTGA
jgi:hypothetical protein